MAVAKKSVSKVKRVTSKTEAIYRKKVPAKKTSLTKIQGESFFDPWQGDLITNWDLALFQINTVIGMATGNKKRDLAWRGVVDAKFSLHSSLYRRFVEKNETVPDETDLVKFEQQILEQSRTNWRFDNLSALETLAHIQHYGGPTRLLDVTFNPLIALWFAVEQQFYRSGKPKPDIDGRLFAFDVTDRQIELDETWGGRALPWASFSGREKKDWRAKLPMVWRPPSYNERIPAQNSASLLGGVPMVWSGDNAKYRKGPGDGSVKGNWNINEVRQSTSVTVSMNSFAKRPQKRSTPTYTLRIKASCKAKIRTILEDSFGYNPSTVYPDLYGLATHAANRIVI